MAAVSGQRSAVSGQRSAVSGHLKMAAKLRFSGVNVKFKVLFINNLHVIKFAANSQQPTANSHKIKTKISSDTLPRYFSRASGNHGLQFLKGVPCKLH